MKNSSQKTKEQYLTFSLGCETFALDIVKVREVLTLTKISHIPRAPGFMRGVISLRGHAVPVVDMRSKLSMPHVEDTVDSCIIILEVEYGSELLALGALVDSVREVVEIMDEDIEPAPRMGAGILADYIMGMGHQGDSFIIIVDIDSIFLDEELKSVVDTSEIQNDIVA